MTDELREPRGWHSRGYLPHFDGGEIIQFITFRLADSLPSSVLERWSEELRFSPTKERERGLRERIEHYLDSGHGKCYLRIPALARMMQDALLYHDNSKYRLISWTVMPNHVHVLLKPINGHELSEIQHSIKSYTANEINRFLNRRGQLWQEEVFDRFIRDGEHFSNVVLYINNNPAKAGLCASPEDWPFGSAGYRRPT